MNLAVIRSRTSPPKLDRIKRDKQKHLRHVTPTPTHPMCSSAPADGHGSEDGLQACEEHLPGGAVPVGHTQPKREQSEEEHDEGDREGHLDCRAEG